MNYKKTPANFNISGVHPIEEALRALDDSTLSSTKLLIAKTRSNKDLREILQIAEQKNLRIIAIDPRECDEKAQNKNHQGIILQLPHFKYTDLDELDLIHKNNPLLLALDQIQDTHNLGAIIRSATAFNVDAIIIPKNRAACINPTVIKTSAGLAYQIPICQITNLVQTLKKLKNDGYTIIGAAAGQNSKNIDYTKPTVLVMGSEAKGLRRLTLENCDYICSIKHNPKVDSLNVSVAAAILLSQIYNFRYT